MGALEEVAPELRSPMDPNRGAGQVATRIAALGYRTGRRLIVVGAVVCGAAGSVQAQLTNDDIAALRQQGRAEGWTFSVRENEATRRPLHELCGLIQSPDGRIGGTRDPSSPKSSLPLPAAFDWHDSAPAQPIRDQAGCGSCWAFAAVSALEYALLINEGVTVDLSEQWLISCVPGTCSGGTFYDAFSPLSCDGRRDACGGRGAVPESYLPYQASMVTCSCPYPHLYCLDSWDYLGDRLHVPSANEIKQVIMNYGPVVASVRVNGPFMAYSEGIFNACENVGAINHAGVLVGWDDNQGANGVWFFRNSWGAGWGEDGYMRIEYGCSRIGLDTIYLTHATNDCNLNGISDIRDIASQSSKDCNTNGIPDECDIASGESLDINLNRTPDECVVLYVDQNATGANTGRRWRDAYNHLQDALEAAVELGWVVQEIRVAQGTYRTDEGAGQTPGDRAATFRLQSGITLKGGYAGARTIWANHRDVASQHSILTGDLSTSDQRSFHVVTSIGVGSSAVLDGFVIESGRASSSVEPHDRGGGIYNEGGSPTLIDCAFRHNSTTWGGGAMYSCFLSRPTLTNCTFTWNSAGSSGGALYNYARSRPTLVNCVFADNTAGYGGAIVNFADGLTLTDCSFTRNHASANGGALLNSSQGTSILTNCTFRDCTAGAGGAVFCYMGDPTFTNCMFSGCRADTSGGALYSGAGSAVLTNCTISDCAAAVAGGGIFSRSSSLVIANSILWENTAPQGTAVALVEGSDLNLSYTNLHHGAMAISQEADCRQVWGRSIFDDDPLFVVGPAGCLYLSHVSAGQAEDSPCVSAGNSAATTHGLARMTTRSDEDTDTNVVDIGFHYPITNRRLVMGDVNRDGELDMVDFAGFQACVTGEHPEQLSRCCKIFDFEADGDVDLADYAMFQPVLTNTTR